jgi:hypothetical protein
MDHQLEVMPDDWRRLLAIVAHPDDLEYGAASAIAGWTRAGKWLGYVVVTNGEAGVDGRAPDDVGPIRVVEQELSWCTARSRSWCHSTTSPTVIIGAHGSVVGVGGDEPGGANRRRGIDARGGVGSRRSRPLVVVGISAMVVPVDLEAELVAAAVRAVRVADDAVIGVPAFGAAVPSSSRCVQIGTSSSAVASPRRAEVERVAAGASRAHGLAQQTRRTTCRSSGPSD